MPDTKLADLTSGTAEATDIVYAVKDPSGTPVDRKIALSSVKDLIVGSGSVSVASGKTLTANNTLTLAGTDATTMTFPSTSATLARTDAGNTFTGNQTVNGGTITADAPVLNMSQTWNASGVTFTGLKFNATDTASANGSLLMDLQIGGTSRFNVQKVSGGGTVLNIGNTVAIQQTGSTIAFRTTALTDTAIQASVATLSTGLILSGTSSLINFNSDLFLTRRAAANLRLGAADTNASATITVTIASPGVVTWTSHGLLTGAPVNFSTTGALPTGITAGTTYYVIAVDANSFQLATSEANALAGTALNTSGTQSGTHTGFKGALPQILSVQSNSAGVSNLGGAPLRITGSQGTGTGAGGSIIFQVAPAGSSGTAQNALATAFQVNGNGGVTGQDGATANTLALRNGTNAQTFNVYNTYTSSTNFERFRIVAQSAAAVLIGTEKGSGGGTARALALQTDGTTRLTIETNGDLTIADAENIILGTTTGTKIGTSTSQKIGFFNKAPVVQPTAVADATDAATVITQLNALLSRMRDLGLIAT